MQEKVHCELRNLLMMVLVPRPLHEDGARQAAYLRATVSRIVNPTVMQSKGLDFLRPIWRMIYSNESYCLNLSESDVSITYTRYINNYKNKAKRASSNDQTIDDAVKNNFTPVGMAIVNGSPHAMVL